GARGLADDHEAGASARACDEAIDRRDKPSKCARADPRAEAAHGLVILDRGRHAEKWHARATRSLRIGAASRQQGAPGGDCDERTELVVARADGIEARADELDRGHLAPAQSLGELERRHRARSIALGHAISSARSIKTLCGPLYPPRAITAALRLARASAAI